MDMNTVYLALAACSAISVLLIGLAIPLALGKVVRNGFYGFRTPKTLASDEVWYPANRASGFNFIYAGIFILLTAAILFFLKDRLPASTVVAVMAGVTFLALVAAVVKSFMFLSRLTADI